MTNLLITVLGVFLLLLITIIYLFHKLDMQVVEEMTNLIRKYSRIFKDSYVIGKSENQFDYIQCLECGRKSYNFNDIKNHYCANCGKFLKHRVYLGDSNE